MDWAAQGLRIEWIVLLLDDPGEGDPTLAGALRWKEDYNLESAYVAPDRTFSMVPGYQVGTPQFSIMNPRTMEIIFLQEGTGPGSTHLSRLEQLARDNRPY